MLPDKAADPLVMARSDNGARSAARAAVGRLSMQCQTDAPSASEAIEEALRNAADNGWDDIRLSLLHVKIIATQIHDPGLAGPLTDELQREAERLGMRAMEAVALIDRIRGSRYLGVQEPFQTYATARALLSDPTQPQSDRVAGLINLAVEFEMIDLIELAGDTLAEAAEAAAHLEDGSAPLAVIAHNRSFALLRRAMTAVMVNELGRAQELFDEHLPLVAALNEAQLPTSDSSELRATRRVLEVLLADEDIAPSEAEALIEALAARDAELGVVIRCLVPLDEWSQELRDPHVALAPEHEELARFVRLRSYRRAGVADDAYLIELERYSSVLVVRAERARRELEAGVAAMISADLMAAERGELVAMAMADPLTGLSNRRAFQSRMQGVDQGPATLVLVDLDDFKRINDTYGHQAGDEVLNRFASLLTEASRPFRPEVVARIGGDELAVILAGDRSDEASQLAVAFTERVKAADWGVLDYVPTASIGIASGPERASVFDRADANLYTRKGRRPRVDRSVQTEQDNRQGSGHRADANTGPNSA